MKTSPTLKAAMTYLAEYQWASLALCPGDHVAVGSAHHRICQNPGKTPIQRWMQWQSHLPTIDELLAQWRWQPNANVGICLGPVSLLVGIDVDGPGDEHLLKDVSKGDLPLTLAFTTSRGYRLLYRLPQGVCVQTRHIQAGGNARVSVLAHGTQTAMPPSRHRSGKQYRWLVRQGPQHLEAAIVPGWLYRQPPQPPTQGQHLEGGVITEGDRNLRLFKVACALRRFGATFDEILVTVHLINGRCEPPLEAGELETISRSAARYSATA